MSVAAQNDFALLAVIDAYKWWISYDYGFLQATGILDAEGKRTTVEIGSIDQATMTSIMRAYLVARNVPVAYVGKFSGWLGSNCFKEIAKQPFAERAASLVKFCEDHKVTYRKGGQKKEKTLASAISKLSWFMQPEDWTVFDRYVGAAALRTQGAGCPQMAAYYARISNDWPSVSNDVCNAVKDRGFNRLIGLRIIDKYLFCHGLGMYGDGGAFHSQADTQTKLNSTRVVQHRASLLATEQALKPYLGDRLCQLAAALDPCLNGARWKSANTVDEN